MQQHPMNPLQQQQMQQQQMQHFWQMQQMYLMQWQQQHHMQQQQQQPGAAAASPVQDGAKETKETKWTAPAELQQLLQRIDAAAAAIGDFDDWEASDEEQQQQQQQQHLSVLDEAETKKMKLLKADAATAFTCATSGVQTAQSGVYAAVRVYTAAAAASDEDSSEDDSSEEANKELIYLKDLERRMEAFKEMLREENFGPFAVYEKCLPRLVYQPRFSAITADQRKRLFDRCIKELAAESRKGQKEHIEALRQLLDEAKAQGHVHSSSTVETLERRFGKDPRWQGGTVPSGEWAAIRRRLVEETVEKRRQDKSQAREEIKRQFKKFA
ncbi:FF domain-containing protein, putative, partial [Eimeria tenella]